ncbi:unnamed protein product [Phytophthora fragariaefolia]|uniref:Unnamed protein product n=1 Tax=Phytophthora fragariaefolia TaxID=1490495 RepID=A0A9W6YEQ8_9STRA|nr:unnamed protein product [Phytophthora fragariaefolia]
MVLLIKIPKEFQVTKLEQAVDRLDRGGGHSRICALADQFKPSKFNIPATTMAPPPTRQAVNYVLLFPELLDQGVQEQQYAKVTRRMRSGVTLCGIGSERERKWKITIEQALAWAVSADEVETNPSPLIPSPVVIIKDGHFIHGQVAACNGEGAVVNRVGGIHRLLDRILGTNDATATNDVQQIMRGIIDDVMTPSADEIVMWINPLFGQEVAFPVQHAVDYAFYKDGGVEPTPDSVGASFCTPPTASNQRQVTETTRTARRISPLHPSSVSTRTAASAMFDTQDDDDDVLEEIEVGAPTDGPNHEVQQFVPPPTKRARTTLSVAQQQHTGEILAALASQPRLQCIFAENYLPDS